jgi:RNA 2',3'-cyclic 3'-phosphodiesterase
MDKFASFSRARFFLAAVPDADTAQRIHRLAGVLKRAHQFEGRLIAPECLHISLFFLGGWHERAVHVARETAAAVRVVPFEISFDRTASFRGKAGNRPFVLVGDAGLERLRSFRKKIGAALALGGLNRVASTNFEPHITLLYNARNVEEYPIEPIRWTVTEFVLIRSMNGHHCLARWSLAA